MELNDDNYCLRCKNEQPTCIYLVWKSSFVSPFWKQVIKEWLRRPLPEPPQLCLLGDRSAGLSGLLTPQGLKSDRAWFH